jgi:hypothetical protein
MDKLIDCPCCSSDACFVDETTPNISTYFCYGCGFQTNSLMKEGEEFYEQQISILPELYKDLLNKDDDEIVWMPSTINLPQQGMVFANGPSKNDWGWAAVKAVPVKKEEKEKYPIPNQKGKFYEWRMDMTTLKMFVKRDYMEALSYIGVLPE